MKSWTKELDEAAVLVTSKGYWHIVLFYLLCALAAIPTSITVFVQIFTNATPEHWCAPPPELEVLGLPESVLRNLTVPQHDGLYEKCSNYVLDTKALYKELSDVMYERNELVYEGGVLREIKTYQLQPVEGDERDEQDSLRAEEVELGCVGPPTPVQIITEDQTTIHGNVVNKYNNIEITQIVENITSMRKKSEKCTNGWKYSTEQYANTLVTEFSLVCDRNWLTPMSYTFFWIGSLVGNVCLGWMSDRYGRRFTILFIVYLLVPLAIATAFPNSYTTYILLKLIGGLFFPTLYQQPFILATELMPPSKRTNAGIVAGVLFSLGMCLLALIAYAIRDWYQLTLATSVPFLLLFGYYWLIPESPRWLASKGRLGDAEKVLRTLAKKNGIKLPPGFLLDIHKNIAEETDVTLGAVNENAKLRDAFGKNSINHDISNLLKFEPDHKILSKKDNENRTLPNIRIGDGTIIKNNDNEIPLLCDDTAINLDEAVSKKNLVDSHVVHLKRESSQIITGIFLKSNSDVTEDDSDDHDTKTQATMLDLFRYPNIRKKFLISTFDCLLIAVIYNGLSYNTSNLGVNDYLAFFIGGAVEIPAYILVWRCMERFGRRWVLCIFMIFGGLSCLICGLIPEGLPWVTLTLAMIGKLCAAACLAVSYLLIGELLPTVVRSQGIGLSSFITGFGILTCPYIVYSAVYMKSLPLIIMGILGIIAGLLPLFLPETVNQPLPQTLADGEMFGRTVKVFSWLNTR